MRPGSRSHGSRRWRAAETPRVPYSRRGEIRLGRGALALRALELHNAGVATTAIARTIGVARSTVRSWLERRAGVAQSAEATGLNPVQCGFESLHQHQYSSYAYLLGMYLGDGYVARIARTYKLRVFLSRKHQDIISRVVTAIRTVVPSRAVGRVDRRRTQVTEVTCYFGQWPSILPQHGPGRKHRRRIALEPWQAQVVRAHPVEFLRGLVDSDGCRHRRIVHGRNYPAYGFTNVSEDILGLFIWACDLVGSRSRRASRRSVSIARRADVQRLDELFGVATGVDPGETAHPPASSRPR